MGAPGCYLLSNDLSGGAERVDVPVVGPSRDFPLPTPFRYITVREHSDGVDRLAGKEWASSAAGCSCSKQGCGAQCEHVQEFDEAFPGEKDVNGVLMKGRQPHKPTPVGVFRICLLAPDSRAPVHECNAHCLCGPSCRSRVLQNGLRARLFVRPARRHRGWAVHTSEPIPAGAFIAEYVGEVIDRAEAETRGEQQDREGVSFLFSIDSHVALGSAAAANVYTVDASRAGNVTRFVNHSCAPNCRIRSVIWDSSDACLAHLALYALRDIDVGEELTYDYGVLL